MTQMDEIFHTLTKLLLEKNQSITYDTARTWIEYLWEDFESTRAKAGHQYIGPEVTERYVKQIIDYYGPEFDQYISANPKFKHLMNPNGLKH